jgi:hypothetical protein
VIAVDRHYLENDMRRRIASCIGLFVGAVLLASCGPDSQRGGPTGPTSPLAPKARSSTQLAGTCTNVANLTSLINTVFGAGSPNANSATGKLNNLQSQLQHGDTAGAQAQAQNLISFIQTKAQGGGLPGTPAQIQLLIAGIQCYAGLASNDSFLIFPSDQPQILKHSSGKAAISLQGNTVSVPTLITVTFLSTSTPPLLTKLDQYPGFIALTQSSVLTKAAVIAVCPDASVPASVLGRLRLGHQAITGFEITPAADGSFLDCSTTVGQTGVSGMLHRLASFFLPTTLYAKPLFESSGVAGSAVEFSPFAPVDDGLFLSSGATGTQTEFQKLPGTDSSRVHLSPSDASSISGSSTASRSLAPRNRANTVDANGVCTAIDGPPGQQVQTACRPAVTVKTFQGTLMTGVPISWAITQGGGTVAPEATNDLSCGPFASTASTTTDLNANAVVCWILGPTPGANTVVATPAPGGDAPLGVFFNGTFTFNATANLITPTVGATGGTFQYTGNGFPGSGTCSNNLTPALSYSGNGTVPVNVGTYTLTVTCGAGNPLFNTATGTATIQITPATTTTILTCPASAVFTGSALTPCSASVTGPGLSQAVNPTYSNNTNVGTATANAAYTGVGNYASSSATATTFLITAASSSVSVSCPTSVAYTGSALTPCTAMVTGPGGLSAPVPVTYVSNVNAGPATATATYTATGNWSGSSNSAQFQITAAATTAAISCPASVKYTGSPVTPCTGSVTGPGLSQSLTPTYTNNTVGTATAAVNYAGGGNYQQSTASTTFQIGYVQQSCFASPIYSAMPSTKSYQNAGSNLQIKCSLLTASGAGVLNATGNLLVQDKGTDGMASPVTVFSLPNAFKSSGSGNYAYGLNTGLPGFVSGHYYYVTATWSDGSTTNGWFYIK